MVPVVLAIGSVAVLVPEARSAATWLAGVSVFMAAVGLIDDVRELPASTRLVAHILAGLLVVVGFGPWQTIEWPGLMDLNLGWVAGPFTVLVVVGFTNAYNFMDGADGIAGTQAVAAGLGWIVAGSAIQDPVLAVAGAGIAMASLGFLLFNWSPASVFMGDVGSAFLGFLLAALSVYVAPRSPATAMAGFVFVWPFVFDTTFTLLRRAGRRENLLTAHRSHLYQRLVLTGVSHRTVALLYGALALVGVVVGNASVLAAGISPLAGALVISLLAAALWLAVVSRERSS